MHYLPSDVLWLTVLERAMADYTEGPDEEEIRDYVFRVQEDARAWVEHRGSEPGSFTWVCHRVGVDPDQLRSRLRRSRKGMGTKNGTTPLPGDRTGFPGTAHRRVARR